MRIPRVSVLKSSDRPTYDLFCCACGFESRAATFIQRSPVVAKTKIAFGFTQRKELAFESNHAYFLKQGFKYEEVDDGQFRGALAVLLAESTDKDRSCLSVGVDISCFNRTRLALIIDSLRRLSREIETVTVDFFYTLATYTSPPEQQAANVHVGPVCDEFAGWTSNPSLPPAAIVGLGYEQDKALGALEHLQVPRVIAFIPKSQIGEYESALLEANSSLLERLSRDCQVYYRVQDPVSTFVAVESLIEGLKREFNPILLPFGPKPFFVIAILAACYHDEVAVWRVSAGSGEKASDREPSEFSIAFRANFEWPGKSPALAINNVAESVA